MNREQKLRQAVRHAQRILAEHVQPGARDCEQTIDKLLHILDDSEVVAAVDSGPDAATLRDEHERSDTGAVGMGERSSHRSRG